MTTQLETPATCPEWCVVDHIKEPAMHGVHSGNMVNVGGEGVYSVGLMLYVGEGDKIQVAADNDIALELVPAVTAQLNKWASEFLAGVQA